MINIGTRGIDFFWEKLTIGNDKEDRTLQPYLGRRHDFLFCHDNAPTPASSDLETLFSYPRGLPRST
jgi:hypothetical protein